MDATFSVNELITIILFAISVLGFIIAILNSRKQAGKVEGILETKLDTFREEMQEFKDGAKERTDNIVLLKQSCVDFDRHLKTHDEVMRSLTDGVNGLGARVNEHDRKIAHIEGRQDLIENKLVLRKKAE